MEAVGIDEYQNNLTGNVAEWTADSYRPYSDPTCWPDEARDNPVCLLDEGIDGLRTVRGGSYRSMDLREVRNGSRVGVPADTQRDDIGFRCVYDE